MPNHKSKSAHTRRNQRRVSYGAESLSALAYPAGSVHELDHEPPSEAKELLEGRFLFDSLSVDLGIHASDALELESATATVTLPPGLTISLLLNGQFEAGLGSTTLRASALSAPSGHLWIHRQAIRLRRKIRPGQRVRKVHVTLPMAAVETLCAHGNSTAAEQELNILCKHDYLSLRNWSVSAQSIRCAEEILAPEAELGLAGKLLMTVNALIILRDALSQLGKEGAQKIAARPSGAGSRDVERARRVRQYVIKNLDGVSQLGDIARRTGMSISTLQRVFKASFGVTVIEFIRTRRLERARDSLMQASVTVGEAAYQAGYSSATNFATAFQREFGYPPSHCLSTD